MLTATLHDEATSLWNEYLRAEQDRVRAVVTERLARFIDRLLQQDEPVWQAWALDTAASVADGGAEIVVRDFRRHVATLREAERHGALIEECAEHYSAHRDYVQQDRPGGSYAHFFERRAKST